MGKRKTSKLKRPPRSKLLRLIKVLIVVALALALGWWGRSLYSEYGTQQVAASPPARRSTPRAPQPEQEERALLVGEPLTVHFMHRSYYLHKVQMSDIREFLADLGSFKGLEFHIDAYTSVQGSKSYNKGLSEKRARAVRNYLRANGVPGSSIITRAHGESDPVANNWTDSGRGHNRRATITVAIPK